MEKVGIVAVASYGEARGLADALGLVQREVDGAYELFANANESVLLITPGLDHDFMAADGQPVGRPGKVSAAAVTAILIEHYHVDAVINAGTAAGIAGHDLAVGDVIVADYVANHDIQIPLTGYEAYGTRKIAVPGAEMLQSLNLPCKLGTVSSAESFTVDSVQWRVMTKNGAVAHEMEAAGVLQAVQILNYQKPVIVIKAITSVEHESTAAGSDEAANYEQNVAVATDALKAFLIELVQLLQAA